MTQRRCPPFTEPYTIQRGDTLYKIAMERNTTPAVIQFLNPFITSPYSLVVGQIICVPVRGQRPPCPNGFYYTIKSGDTFYKIAEEYGITVRELQAANPFVNPYALAIGQVICIPRRAVSCPGGRIHTIRQGDTLLRIAQQYDISYNALVAANPGVQPENLQIGQQLCIPPYEPAQLCPTGKQYIIKEGENLTKIAEKFTVAVTDLLRCNPNLAPCEFVPGRLICIPPAAHV